MGLVINLLRLAALLVVVVIGVGIAFVVLDAREKGTLVGDWLDVCRTLTEPFDRIVDLKKGKEDEQIAINWGIAALVYLVAALLVAGLLARLTRRRA